MPKGGRGKLIRNFDKVLLKSRITILLFFWEGAGRGAGGKQPNFYQKIRGRGQGQRGGGGGGRTKGDIYSILPQSKNALNKV